MFSSYEPGRGGLRHPDRQLHPAAGRLRRPELLHAGSGRALRDPHRQRRRRERRPHLPVPLQEHAARTSALPIGGKNVPCRSSTSADRAGAATPAALNVIESYTVTMIRGDRRNGAARRRSPTPRPAARRSSSRPTHRRQVDSPTYAQLRRPAHLPRSSIPAATPAAGCSSASARRASWSTWARCSTWSTCNPLGARDAEAERPRRQERHDARARGADRCLTRGKQPVIGGWTTASAAQARRTTDDDDRRRSTTRPQQRRSYTQVSRLGMPLVNEVVIGLKDKDKFNASEPKDDGSSRPT